MIEFTLHEWVTCLPPDYRQQFLKDAGYKSASYLNQHTSGIKKMTPDRAKVIEKLTYGMVPAHLLLPDVYERPKYRHTNSQDSSMRKLIGLLQKRNALAQDNKHE